MKLSNTVELWLEAAAQAQAARNPSGSNIQVAYSLPPEGGSGFGDLVYATVPLGSVATKVARDWLANELYEPSRRGKIDAACRDRKVWWGSESCDRVECSWSRPSVVS